MLLREFDCGVALVNGHTEAVVVDLTGVGGGGLRRLAGQQAPLHQLIVDDASPAFRPGAARAWVEGSYDSGYDGAGNPTAEQVRPANGYFHHWARGARRAAGGSTAAFDLGVPAAGAYNVSMWWPAAVPARAGWATAMRLSLAPDGAAATVDLTRQGGDEWLLIFAGAQLAPGSALMLECPQGGGDCIADAVLLESEARFNDGGAADSVQLQPLDAIVLQKAAAGAAAHAACGAGR